MSPSRRDAGAPKESPLREFSYASWVQRHRSIPADAAVLGAPNTDSFARAEEARKAGVTTAICGFLPDELIQTEPAFDACAAWILARGEFLPYTFDDRPESSALGRSLVLVRDPATPRELTTIAEGWSAGARLELRQVGVELPPSELSAAVAGAAMVINGLTDWLVGFAVDEYAARLGRPCVRFCNPGFSPLRYALLDQTLGADRPGGIPYIRTLLANTGTERSRAVMSDEVRAWFAPAEAAARWRGLFNPVDFADYWKGIDWMRHSEPGAPKPLSWLDRPTAWPALARTQSGRFPVIAANRAPDTMTSWLIQDMRAREFGTHRRIGLSRWVRLFPSWIAKFRAEAGETAEVKSAVLRWTMSGIQWQAAPQPALPLLRSAAWIISESHSSPLVSWLGRMQGGGWREVAKQFLAEADPPVEWRMLFARLLAEGFTDIEPVGSYQNWQSGLREMQQAPDAWFAVGGSAAPVLRLLAILQLGDRDGVRVEWRAFHRILKLHPAQGLARLVRASFAVPADFHLWVQALARENVRGDILIAHRLVGVWYQRRLWALWRGRMDPTVERELSCALSMQATIAVAGSVGRNAWQMLATLRALSPLGNGVHEALQHFADAGGNAAEAMLSRALSRWLRGDSGGAVQLLKTWPSTRPVPTRVQFLQAVTFQLLGMLEQAAQMLTTLRQSDAAFLRKTGIQDTRWVWSAVVMRRAGREAEANELRAQAIIAAPGSEDLIDDIDAGTDALADGWLALLEHSPLTVRTI